MAGLMRVRATARSWNSKSTEDPVHVNTGNYGSNASTACKKNATILMALSVRTSHKVRTSTVYSCQELNLD